jgi:hypothetical protein
MAMSQQQIKQVRARDLADKKAYISAVNRSKERLVEQSSTNIKPTDIGGSVLHRLWQTIVRWLS